MANRIGHIKKKMNLYHSVVLVAIICHASVQDVMTATESQRIGSASKKIVINKCCEDYQVFDIDSKNCFEPQTKNHTSSHRLDKISLLGKYGDFVFMVL